MWATQVQNSVSELSSSATGNTADHAKDMYFVNIFTFKGLNINQYNHRSVRHWFSIIYTLDVLDLVSAWVY